MPVPNPTITIFVDFTGEYAEKCSGPWIAICGTFGCTFKTVMQAGGLTEAKSIAYKRHTIARITPNSKGTRDCPMILVSRVPDEE